MNKKNIIIWSIFFFVALLSFTILYYFFFVYDKDNNLGILNSESKKALDPIIVDQGIYADAVNTLDIEKCKKINDENIKSICHKSLTNINYFNEASKQFNVDICSKINIETQRDECIKLVNNKISHFEEVDPAALANIYLKTHNDKALEAFEKIVEEKQDNLNSLVSLALAYAEKGLYEQSQGRSQDSFVKKAIDVIEKAKKISADDADVLRAEAYIYEIKPDIFKSLDLYGKAIEKDAKNILAYIGRGHVHKMLGLLDKAMEDFKAAEKLDTEGTMSTLYLNICTLEASRGKMIDEALKYCQKVVDIKGANVADVSQAYQIISHLYLVKADINNAEINLTKAISLTPFDSNLHVTLSRLYLQKQEFDNSLASALEASKLSPEKVATYMVLARSYYGLGDYDKSIEASNSGISFLDKDVSLLLPNKTSFQKDLYYLLADAYKMKGDTENELKYKGLGDESTVKSNNVEEVK